MLVILNIFNLSLFIEHIGTFTNFEANNSHPSEPTTQNMRSLLFSLLIVLTAAPFMYGAIVSKDQARQVAGQFLLERIQNNQTDWAASSIALIDEKTVEFAGEPALYVFSNNGTGFVIISADDELTPVLGYAYSGEYPETGKAPSFDFMIQEYVRQVALVRSEPGFSPEALAEWNYYLSPEIDRSGLATTDIEPLMTCLWNQDSPYNILCPEDPDGPGGHVYAGCVATAMSMIMYYYRYPLQGIGTHSYYASGYGTQSVNYGNTQYDWDGMIDQLNGGSGQCIPAVALLQYHAGVAVNMQYSPSGSGAYSTDVPSAMISHFGYSTSTQYLSRNSYSATQWENMIVEQLDALKPVYYSGTDPTPVTGGGHAFICDGYQVTGSTKMFHFNFGWGGSGNGYYTLANPNGFTTQQGMVRNAVPATNYPYGCDERTITVSNGSFEDGSSLRLNYDPNSDCRWLIDPADSVNSISLTFISFDVDPSDAVSIYDGDSDAAPLIGTYTGNSLPPVVSSTGGKMYIKFTTDGSAEAAGWLAEFHATYPGYCSGTATLTDPYGDISDGSGPNNYNNGATCKWKIQPPYATGLTLTFTEFDLEENDELMIYATGASSIHLATLTGNEIPEPIVSPTSALLLMFKANGYNPAGGFAGYYTTTNVGAPELEGISDLQLTPNPASIHTVVKMIVTEPSEFSIYITDMTGKLLYQDRFSAPKGTLEKTIQLEQFVPGMYLFNMTSEKGKINRKLIIK